MWADAFASPPAQWGLRGDPFVWEEMQRRLADTAVPAGREEADLELRRCFADVVGVDLSDRMLGDSSHLPEFAHGGMSSGQVHLPTWRTRLLPLLLDRATG